MRVQTYEPHIKYKDPWGMPLARPSFKDRRPLDSRATRENCIYTYTYIYIYTHKHKRKTYGFAHIPFLARYACFTLNWARAKKRATTLPFVPKQPFSNNKDITFFSTTEQRMGGRVRAARTTADESLRSQKYGDSHVAQQIKDPNRLHMPRHLTVTRINQ